MSIARSTHLKVGAPAVVMLATIVNVAVGDTACAAALSAQPCRPDLSWALKGGATHAAQSTRVLMARKAATQIRSLDADAVPAAACSPQIAILPEVPSAASAQLAPAADHRTSTYQHSAP
ncbi:MAG TPA: hypothetical protein VGP72_16810 [Planctomycetota bacterium]|jgi:hypothetical protein